MRALRIIPWIGVLAACLTGGPAQAQKAEGVRVAFIFGKAEALQKGSKEWQFLRPGMSLRPDDLVRMPPASLLRLEYSDGAALPLLTGLHERTTQALLKEAFASQTRGESGSRSLNAGETPIVGALPTDGPKDDEGSTPALKLTADQAARWKELRHGGHPALINAVNAARAKSATIETTRAYPTPRTRLIRTLADDAARALRERTPLATLYSEGDASGMFLLTALYDAAGIQTRRELVSGGRPALLVRTDIDAGAHRQLTANRRLLHLEPLAQVWIPLYPTPETPTFLEAWYGGEMVLRAAN